MTHSNISFINKISMVFRPLQIEKSFKMQCYIYRAVLLVFLFHSAYSLGGWTRFGLATILGNTMDRETLNTMTSFGISTIQILASGITSRFDHPLADRANDIIVDTAANRLGLTSEDEEPKDDQDPLSRRKFQRAASQVAKEALLNRENVKPKELLKGIVDALPEDTKEAAREKVVEKTIAVAGMGLIGGVVGSIIGINPYTIKYLRCQRLRVACSVL